MSVHQKVYDTRNLSEEEALTIVGGASLMEKRKRLEAFLADHEWNEREFKAWIASVWNVAQPRRKDPPKITSASRGFGDTVAKITTAIGITPCGGCKKRQAKLNKLFPYKS